MAVENSGPTAGPIPLRLLCEYWGVMLKCGAILPSLLCLVKYSKPNDTKLLYCTGHNARLYYARLCCARYCTVLCCPVQNCVLLYCILLLYSTKLSVSPDHGDSGHGDKGHQQPGGHGARDA